MKKSKKFLSVLCAVCIVMAMAAPAFAAASNIGAGIIRPRDVTDSVEHKLNSGSSTDSVNWAGSSQYCYWKIAVQNRSSAKIRVHLFKNGTTDTLIRTMEIPANDSEEFVTDVDFSDQILTDAKYHLSIVSDDGSKNLNGTLWYKFSTTPIELP